MPHRALGYTPEDVVSAVDELVTKHPKERDPEFMREVGVTPSQEGESELVDMVVKRLGSNLQLSLSIEGPYFDDQVARTTTGDPVTPDDLDLPEGHRHTNTFEDSGEPTKLDELESSTLGNVLDGIICSALGAHPALNGSIKGSKVADSPHCMLVLCHEAGSDGDLTYVFITGLPLADKYPAYS